jgi:endonuclease-8
MPEGDTVWLATRRMHDALAGRVLTRTDFRVPSLATTDLTGRAVVEVVCRGKHMLTRIDGGLTLHTHFLMQGSWGLFAIGARSFGGPDHEIRVVLANDAWQAIGYRLPVIELLPTERESDVVGHLGPDLLGADWDESEATRRILAEPDREIGEALLDQRNLAGIGNLYKTEALFLGGITPWTAVKDLTDLSTLIRRARRMLLANRDRPEQSTTGDRRRGRDHWVFERAGQPCRRCGTPITRARQGTPPRERICYWCPHCQAGPTPAAS